MSDLKYAGELKRAMEWLAQDPRTIFLGQAVEVAGTAMSNTVKDIPLDRRLEMPVCEEMQMGITNGLALAGFVPVSLYPRWNFMVLALNQIVNHLDKMSVMSSGEYQPKVILRTGIGSERPLHPQYQHIGDYTDAFRSMLTTIDVIRLDEPEQIFPAYEKALLRDDGRSTLLVEWGDYYGEK